MLETQSEVPSDVFFIQLVKLRQIGARIADTPWSRTVPNVDPSLRPPAMFYLKSLEGQLHQFKCQIPEQLIGNSKLISVLPFRLL